MTQATEAMVNYTVEHADPPKATALQATDAITCAKEAIEPTINQVFKLYSNLLWEEAWRPWNKVFEVQIDCKPRTDLYGVEHMENHKRSWSLFMDCISCYLLMTFLSLSDVAKTQ